MSLFSYIKNEVTRSYLLDHDQERYALKREKIYTFMRIPRELEKFMSYGFFHCLDSFLFVYTFLPLRVTLALISIIFRLPTRYFASFNSKQGRIILPAEIIDMTKVLIILVCCYAMSYVDTSMLYHIIKSQSVIKLYLMYNMIEVADRLFSAFGQDTIDALFWTATEPRDRKREHIGLIPHLLLAIFYVFLHGLLVLLQATTLNVAINSSNKALLTIMMSNNFVELKGSVFKKFDKNNLFQVSCSDVRERFHLFALLLIVLLQTMKEYGWKEESFWSLAPDCVTVLGAEILVDWIKHAFITRFNEVSADVYKDYTISLAYDLAQTKQKLAFNDHSDIVSRRMGFNSLPLGVVMLRVIYTAVKSTNPGALLVIILAYVCLFTFRVLCSVVILGKACDLIEEHKKKQKAESTDRYCSPESSVSRSQSMYEDMSTLYHHSAVMEINKLGTENNLFPAHNVSDGVLRRRSINRSTKEKSVGIGRVDVFTSNDSMDTKNASERKTSVANDKLTAFSKTKSLSSPDLIRSEAEYNEDWEFEEQSTENEIASSLIKCKPEVSLIPRLDILQQSDHQPVIQNTVDVLKKTKLETEQLQSDSKLQKFEADKDALDGSDL